MTRQDIRRDILKHGHGTVSADLARQFDDFSTPQGRAIERDEPGFDWLRAVTWSLTLAAVVSFWAWVFVMISRALAEAATWAEQVPW